MTREENGLPASSSYKQQDSLAEMHSCVEWFRECRRVQKGSRIDGVEDKVMLEV